MSLNCVYSLFLVFIVTISQVDLENYQEEVCDDINKLNVHIHDEQKPFSFDNFPVLNLPLIDIGRYLYGSKLEKTKIIESFKYYLHTLGTVALTNHSVNPSYIYLYHFQKKEKLHLKKFAFSCTQQT